MNMINLPAQYDLYDFTGLPDFDNWEEGVQAYNDYQKTKKSVELRRRIFKWIKIASILCAFCLLLEGDTLVAILVGFLFVILAILFRKNGKRVTSLNRELNQAYSKFMATYYKHTDMFIHPLANSLMKGKWRSFRVDGKGLIYSDQRVVYFDTDESLLVAYTNENIKEVYRERVHIGANTVGNSSSYAGGTAVGDTGFVVGSAVTNSNSNTTNYYEWHFDILTNFISYPKISLVLKDSKNVEDFVGTAYAVLKP